MHETRYDNPLGISTSSVGDHLHHALPSVLAAIASAGFTHVDLFEPDWVAYLASKQIDTDTAWRLPMPVSVSNAAAELKRLADELGLKFVCLQPLREIEGHLDARRRKAAFEAVRSRFPTMRALGIDLVFMCSNIGLSGVSHDQNIIANDLAELADMAAEFSRSDGGDMLKIGYEGLVSLLFVPALRLKFHSLFSAVWQSWGHMNTWSDSWDCVRRADRPNLGVVFDTFNILAVRNSGC
jgi:4-hydroxyphenylpyruvate dioxygenase